MNILYTSLFRDGTGYAKGAINTALAIDTVSELNVHCANIKLANQIIEPPQRIQSLLTNKIDKYDVVIQHVLPPMMQYIHGAKNIGYGYFETDNIRPSNWQYHLNLMDEVWVSSKQNKECLERSGVRVPIQVVPIPYYPYPSKDADFGIQNRYAFYHIGDWSSRKNTLNLIKAYFSAFRPWDHVVLVLKTYVEGLPTNKSREFIMNEINNLKISMRRGQYPPIILVTDYMSEESIQELHGQGDCFVSMERGAAWNLPAFEALAHDNCVIVPRSGGPLEFMDEKRPGQILLETRPEVVEGMIRCPYKSLYTSFEVWDDASPTMMALSMREIFDQKPQADNSYLRENFSLQSVGNQIKGLFNVD